MSCLDSLTMAAWVEGTLADAERARALEHIADCAVCREVVSALMLAAQDTTGTRRRDRPEPPAPAHAPGATLGRYQIEGVVASGGMGVVLTATDPTLQRKVAIKIRRPVGLAQAPKLEARLIQEARALAQLRHPNVVAVHDAGRDGDHLFVVMELVEGESLRAWLTRRHPWPDGLRIAIAAGRGLEALHRAGLAHRDVKPDNVLLAADGRVLLADLGLAVQTAGGEHPALTRDGAVVGTPRYLAPEQLAGNRGDPCSDQFSFAVVLREALAVGDAPPPAWLRAVIQRAMDPDPIHRFASMAELLAALDRPPRRHRAALGIAAATAAAVAVTWQAWPRRASDEPAPRTAAPLAVAPPPDATASIGAPSALAPDAAVPAETRAATAPRGKPQTVALQPQPREPAPRTPPAPGPPRSTGQAPRGSGAPPAAPPPRVAASRAPAATNELDDPTRLVGSSELGRRTEQFEGPISVRVDGASRRFQPSTYFAMAQKIGKAMMDDAELVGAAFMPVSRDGSVDLPLAARIDGCNYNRDCGVNYYAFRSPSRSRQPAGVPSNIRTARECGVIVYIYAHYAPYPASAVARYWTTTHCEDRAGPPPRCTLRQVWAAALAQGAPPDAAARIWWAPGAGWGFSTKLTPGADGFEQTFPDNC